MDVCVVTNDALLARFLILELDEVGFTAEQTVDCTKDARLYLCDLDFHSSDLPKGAIGFSYDTGKARSVQTFLPRPIDARALRTLVKERLTAAPAFSLGTSLTIRLSNRRVKSALGEVSLSEKELALLVALCDTPLLKRADAIKLFGDGESNVVDVYMHYLRKKLKKICLCDVICARRSEGYCLNTAVTIQRI